MIRERTQITQDRGERVNIQQSFQALLEKLQPSGAELARLQTHGNSIQSCLSTYLNLHSMKYLGSHDRGTAIAASSDLDLFAIFPRSEVTHGNEYVRSSTVLDRVRVALSNRYRFTRISRDGQAIVLEFTDGSIVDVVPAIFHEMKSINGVTRPVYLIADGDGGWMCTSPEAHATYILQAHAPSGGKFTRCIQLLKFWRNCRESRIPIGSFHLELLLASEGTFSQVGTYQECLYRAFALLQTRRCRAVQDPLGISGHVRTARTEAQVVASQGHVAYAVDKAVEAINAERGGNVANARYYWDMVFNGRFPSR